MRCLFLYIALIIPNFILAAGTDAGKVPVGTDAGVIPPGSKTLINPLASGSSITGFFQSIIDVLLIFAVPFVVFFIIYAGFLYVKAQGKPEEISKAHKALLYALIGGLLILGANVLLDVITNTINDIK